MSTYDAMLSTERLRLPSPIPIETLLEGKVVESERLRLKVHPLARPPIIEDATDQDTDQVTDQVAALVRTIDGEMSRKALQKALNLVHSPHFREAYLSPALTAGLVEMTLPDRPNSRLQRYRLTKKGRIWRIKTPPREPAAGGSSRGSAQ